MSPSLPSASDVKLIVTDVDGTLLDSHHQLQPTNPNFAVLRRIRTEYPQLPIILSTGKQWTSTAKQRDDLDLHPFYACHLNGNVIYRPGGEVLYQGGLELSTVLDVYDRMQRDGMSLFLYDNERVYHVLPFKTGEADYWSKKLRGYGERVTELAEAEEVMRKVRAGEIKVVKLAVCVEENAVPALRASLEAWEPANAFSVTQALTFCIELIPANHNKGTALVTLLNHLNSLPDAQHIDPANVITFGDGENDISMFKVAGMSVAMGNAMPVAKANARWQTGTNDEGGLGKFLESILFTDV